MLLHPQDAAKDCFLLQTLLSTYYNFPWAVAGGQCTVTQSGPGRGTITVRVDYLSNGVELLYVSASLSTPKVWADVVGRMDVGCSPAAVFQTTHPLGTSYSVCTPGTQVCVCEPCTYGSYARMVHNPCI